MCAEPDDIMGPDDLEAEQRGGVETVCWKCRTAWVVEKKQIGRPARCPYCGASIQAAQWKRPQYGLLLVLAGVHYIAAAVLGFLAVAGVIDDDGEEALAYGAGFLGAVTVAAVLQALADIAENSHYQRRLRYPPEAPPGRAVAPGETSEEGGRSTRQTGSIGGD